MWNRIETSTEGAQSQPDCIKVSRKRVIYSFKWVVEGFPSRLAIPLSLQPVLQWYRWELGGCTVRRRRRGGRAPLANTDDIALTRRYCFQLNALLRGSQSAEMNKSFHLWKHSATEQLLPEVKCFHCNVPFQNMENCWLWPLEICIGRHSFGCMSDTEQYSLWTLSQSTHPKSQEHTLPKNLWGGQGENAPVEVQNAKLRPNVEMVKNCCTLHFNLAKESALAQN